MADAYEQGRMRARLAQARKLFKRFLVLQAAMEIGGVPNERLESLKLDVRGWLGDQAALAERRKRKA